MSNAAINNLKMDNEMLEQEMTFYKGDFVARIDDLRSWSVDATIRAGIVMGFDRIHITQKQVLRVWWVEGKVTLIDPEEVCHIDIPGEIRTIVRDYLDK
ncbi:MAG: hypothetical protein IBX61_09425 [Thermoleophilia bacterium]|nr:hypothetical protein [Thermoleophilia bacterium]